MEEQNPQIIESAESKRISLLKISKKWLLFLLVIFSAVPLFYFTYQDLTKQPSPPIPLINRPFKLPTAVKTFAPQQPVVKVAEEQIFEKDILYQAASFPETAGVDQRAIALNRLIKESIILQGGAAENIIKLDPTFFNSLNKDLSKRAQNVKAVQDYIDKNSGTVSGKVISIWFLNSRVGPLGYQKAKQLASEKINSLYQKVKSGNMTVEAAAKAIAADDSLSKLDSAYKTNAIFEFTTTADKSPTHSPEMNRALMNLKVGGLTDIYTVKSADIDQHYQLVDAYYSFGTITARTRSSKYTSFDDWYQKAKEHFNVAQY